MFEKLKNDQEVKQLVVECLDKEIKTKAADSKVSAKEVYELWEEKQKVKMNLVSMGDVVKIAANVIVVGAIMAFEMSHVLNKNAMKFVQPMKFN